MKNDTFNTNLKAVLLALALISAKDATSSLTLTHYDNSSICPAHNFNFSSVDKTNIISLNGAQQFGNLRKQIGRLDTSTKAILKNTGVKEPVNSKHESGLNHDRWLDMINSPMSNKKPHDKWFEERHGTSMKSEESLKGKHFAKLVKILKNPSDDLYELGNDLDEWGEETREALVNHRDELENKLLFGLPEKLFGKREDSKSIFELMSRWTSEIGRAGVAFRKNAERAVLHNLLPSGITSLKNIESTVQRVLYGALDVVSTLWTGIYYSVPMAWSILHLVYCRNGQPLRWMCLAWEN